MRIEKIRQNFGVAISFVHFPLHPETPEEGRTLESLFNCGSDEITQKNEHMKGLMTGEGLPYGKRTHTYNSRLAQELASWATSQPGGYQIHNALFQAYFVEGKNIAETSVLLQVAEETGLDVTEASGVLQSRSQKEAVDLDWSKSKQYGVTGVPTYVVGQTGIVGAQPYEAIEKMLVDAKVTRKQ